MKRQAVIYLATPMTKGEWVTNWDKCLIIADRLRIKGYAPYPPVVSWSWQQHTRYTPEEWLQYDFNLILVSDGVLRVNGDSAGADREMDFAVRHNINTYWSEHELYQGQDPYIDMPEVREATE